MKTVLRWIGVLPGAILVMLLVNTINALTTGIIFPETVDAICKSWFGSLAFVLAAYYIAPKGKVVTAIVIATAYCVNGTLALFIQLKTGPTEYPAWLLIVSGIITILASISGCILAYCFDKEKQTELLKESQKN